MRRHAMVAKARDATHSAQAEPTPRRSRFGYISLVKQAFEDWMEDHATRLAAALAFYTMLSLAPLLVLAVKAVGRIFSEEAARAQVRNYLTDLMGSQASETVDKMIGPLTRPGSGLIATTISVVVLIVSASGVFGELQDSLNTIWEVKPKPNRGVFGIIRDRFLSFVLVIGVCFLLMVSLVITTALAGLTSHLVGNHSAGAWHLINFVAAPVIITLLFAMIYKYLPDVKVRWSDVWPGAITTGLLFSVGKWILGWYLGRASTTSVYAAAGSLISVLLWVYYSAQILFFGAEMTQAQARQSRDEIAPADNAVKVTEDERTHQGMPSKDRVHALAEEADAIAVQPGRK